MIILCNLKDKSFLNNMNGSLQSCTHLFSLLDSIYRTRIYLLKMPFSQSKPLAGMPKGCSRICPIGDGGEKRPTCQYNCIMVDGIQDTAAMCCHKACFPIQDIMVDGTGTVAMCCLQMILDIGQLTPPCYPTPSLYLKHGKASIGLA